MEGVLVEKYIKGMIGVLFLAAVPLLAWAGMTHAQRFSSSTDEGEVVQSSLYSSGKDVNIKGEIFGDVFCAGQDVRVDATVHGDVLCAGRDVTIAGKIDGDIRAAGQSVSVSAEVAKNASLAGSDVSLDADAKIGQDLTVAGSKANIKGSVGRDVVANGSQLVFNGKVGRNVRASSANIGLKSGADVLGDFTYTSSAQLKQDADAIIAGETHRTAPEKRRGYQFNVKMYLFFVSGMIFIVLALAALFPRFLQRTSDRMKASFFKTLIVGVLGGLVVPVVMVGLAFLLVGIPLAIVVFLALLLGAVLSGPISAYYVGRLALKDKAHPMVIGSLGAFILVTLYFLPWVGLIFLLLALWLGFGALLLELKQHAGAPEAPAAKTKKSKA